MEGKKQWLHLIKILFIIVLLLLSSGCWDRIELENTDSVIGLAIDLIDHAAENQSGSQHYKVTAQIAIPGKIPMGEVRGSQSSGGETVDTVLVTEAIGYTIDQAMENMQDKLAHELFLGQLQVVIVSEAVAKKGLTQVNEFLHRRPEVRRTLWLIVSDNKEMLEVSLPMERIPALHMSSMLKSAERGGRLPKIKIGDFWNIKEKLGQEAILPYVKVVENELVLLDGIGYFSEEKMVGRMNTDQIDYYSSLMGENPAGATAIISLPNSGAMVMLESIYRSVTKDIKITDGEPYVNVKVNLRTKIREKSMEAIDLSRPSTIDTIVHEAENQFTERMKNLIAQTQKDGADIFGFGEHIRAKHSNYWDSNIKTKKAWQEKYKHLNIDIETKVEIQRIGMKSE